MATNKTSVYQALALPNAALANGGVEILRAGMIDDELYVTARRAFRDPAKWGDVLADIARRIALLYSAEDTDLTEKEILAEIEAAFAADLGAPLIKDRPKRKSAKHKPRTPRRKARASARKSARARTTVRRKKR